VTLWLSSTSAEIKRTFRFSKAGVLALVDLLYDQLHYITGHGRPLSVLQQLLVALNHSSPAHISSCVVFSCASPPQSASTRLGS